MAGVCGGVIALMADVAVSSFYGWPLAGHLAITVLVTTAGFVIVFAGYKRAKRLSRRAERDELARIDRDAC
jgi:hypothetical protein